MKISMITLLFFFFVSTSINAQTGWTAPAKADKLINPQLGDESSVKLGKALFNQFCVVCHGDKGKGDGIAGMALKPRPTNLNKDYVQKQSDGAIFWKITSGKAPMISYDAILSQEQRWQLVNFIRSF